jgi:hypothetical protein
VRDKYPKTLGLVRTAALPLELKPWTKNTCDCREAAGQPPAGAIPTFLKRGQSFKSLPDWKKKGRRNVELGSGFDRFLAAKIKFSYGAVRTVNLLALRLQWFESTPTQAFPRAILQVFKPLGRQLGISSAVSHTKLFRTSKKR